MYGQPSFLYPQRMSKFYTEKETEKYLERETRLLTLPDGKNESVSVFRLVWIAFDSMHATDAFSKEEIIKWTYDWYVEEKKYSFTTYFENLVAFAFNEVKAKRYGQ